MDDDPPRKRLRRSMRTCYQCRKRKVKCHFTASDGNSCAECIKTGVQCGIEGPDGTTHQDACSHAPDASDHSLRLERIECLLKRLVDHQQGCTTLIDSTEPCTNVCSAPWNHMTLPHANFASCPPAVNDTALPLAKGEEDINESLIDLLPSGNDALSIVQNTTAWLWGAETPYGSVLTPDDPSHLMDRALVRHGQPIQIANSLLLFALYMQQLPGRFDEAFLEGPGVEKAVQLIISRVSAFLSSYEIDDNSFDDIECWLLLGTLHLNAASFRNAWMDFRRCLDLCRLKGLHSSFTEQDSWPRDRALRQRLWSAAVYGDTCYSLLLGLEPGLGTAPFGQSKDLSDHEEAGDKDSTVQRQICLFMAKVAERNALRQYQDPKLLQDLDEELKHLESSAPLSWWRAPSFLPDRPLDSASEPNRLICQLWFFEARIFLHLPFAFSEGEELQRTSMKTCMEVARLTLNRCLGVQHAKEHLNRCRSIEQAMFLATAILLICKYHEQSQGGTALRVKYDSDRALVEQAMATFKAAGDASRREQVPRICAETLSQMVGILDGTPLAQPRPSSQTVSTAEEVARAGLENVLTKAILPMIGDLNEASYMIKGLFGSPKEAQSDCTLDDILVGTSFDP